MMTHDCIRLIVELLAALSMLVAVAGVIRNRNRSGRGIGVRAIQFLAAACFAPTIIILALERILDGCTVAALTGAFVGYLFSNIAEFDQSRRKKLEKTKPNAAGGA